MAEQIGPYKFRKSMGGVTGYKRKDKYFVKEKSSVTRERVLTAAGYARTRENATEWQHATRCSKVIRLALYTLLKTMKLADGHISPRVNAACLRVIRSDREGARGKRRFGKGQVDLMKDIQFKEETTFDSVFMGELHSELDAAKGWVKLTVPAFDPMKAIMAPEGATHFRIVGHAAAIDIEAKCWAGDYEQSDYLSLGEMTSAVSLGQTVVTEPGRVLMHTMGVAFYKQPGKGRYVPVDGGVMKIVGVELVQ